VPLAFGQPSIAVPIAVGALFAGLSNVDEAVGQRWRTMLWTATWVGLGATLGGLTSNAGALQIAFLAILGAGCGFVGAAGPRPALIGIQSLSLYIAFSGAPESQLAAVDTGLLVALGAIIQTAITVLPALVSDRSAFTLHRESAHVLRRLREHLTLEDDFVRHAVRLALALAVAMALDLALGWPQGYWIPLTVAWVSNPNQFGTATRVLGRLAGSMVGVLVAVVIIEGLHLQEYGTAILIGLSSLLLLAFIWANYAIGVACLTVVVIALMALIGDPVGEVADVRIAATLIAAVIVILAAFVWPAARVAHPVPD